MKWQTQKPNTKPIFILPKYTNSKPNFNIERSQNADKIPRKYQEIWDRNTKYRFGFGIFGIPNFWLPIDITISLPLANKTLGKL